jgi:hypothetical protein
MKAYLPSLKNMGGIQKNLNRPGLTTTEDPILSEDDTFKVLKRKVSFAKMCRIMISRENDGKSVDDLLAEYGWEKEDIFSSLQTGTLTAAKLREEA